MELSDDYIGSFKSTGHEEEEMKQEPYYNMSHPTKICSKVNNNCLVIDIDFNYLHSIHVFKVFSGDINDTDCDLFVAYNVNDCFASDKEIKTLFVNDFLTKLSEVLVSNGFSRYATEEIVPLEWALQQMGRARYKAKEVFQEIRSALIVDNVEV